MLMLAIESSAKASSVALLRDGALAAQYFQNSGLTHSRTLMKMVEEILKNSGTKLGELSALAVANGPGSFTGLRIGLASAKGLAFGAQLPLRTVSTLRAAAQVFEDEGVLLCPTMDARRGEVYNALFERRGEKLLRLCGDRAISAHELALEIKRYAGPVLLMGDGAELTLAEFSAEGIDARLAPEMTRLQCAYGVALAAENAPDSDAAIAVPNYLRVSQAERMRSDAAQK